MKFYLSSYKLGNKTGTLKTWIGRGVIGYIPNALDGSIDKEKLEKHIERDVADLERLGIKVEVLDLKKYFTKNSPLKTKLASLRGIFISGGNCFVLRQAMHLSKFDELICGLPKDFVYSGYSAAGCVLGLSLKVYQIVDDPTQKPYREQKEIIWTGLNIVPWAFMPHYKSDHPESKDVEKEVEFCKKNKIPYKTLKDGEVLIIEQ